MKYCTISKSISNKKKYIYIYVWKIVIIIEKILGILTNRNIENIEDHENATYIYFLYTQQKHSLILKKCLWIKQLCALL